MLLADLLKEVKYGNSKKGVKYAEEVAGEVQQFIDVSSALVNAAKELGSTKRSDLNNVISEMTEKFNERLSAKDKEVNYLDFKPVDVISSIGYSSYGGPEFSKYGKKDKVLKSCRTSVPGILEVAEKLGLLVIPTQYVKMELVRKDKILIGNYEKYVHYAYNNFVSEAKKNNLNTWLVCPIQYYDIERHAKDLSYEFFIPSAINQAFTSIKIILPMLIGMIEQIESLQNKVDNISAQLENMRCTLQAQQKQIDRLESELVKERQRRVEEAARVRQLEAQVQEQRAQIQWSTFDPLQIAIPNTVTDINTYEGNAVLGVAWGPEIDDLLVDLLGMQRQETRKDFVTTQYKRFE
jgi:hypothetical protein